MKVEVVEHARMVASLVRCCDAVRDVADTSFQIAVTNVQLVRDMFLNPICFQSHF